MSYWKHISYLGIDSESNKGNDKGIITITTKVEKDSGKGTGLGLSIVYNMIKGHEGTIVFDSVLNKGTTATIKLPINK